MAWGMFCWRTKGKVYAIRVKYKEKVASRKILWLDLACDIYFYVQFYLIMREVELKLFHRIVAYKIWNQDKAGMTLDDNVI